ELIGVVVDLAEIRDLAGVRVRLRGEVQIRFADVTENRHVLGLDAAQIVRPPPARADDREIQLVVQVTAADDRRRGERGSAGHRRPVQKSPARQSLACDIRITDFFWHCGTSIQLNVIGRLELLSKSPPRASAFAEKSVKNGNFGDFVFSLYFFNMPSSVFKTRHKFRPAPIRIIETIYPRRRGSPSV